MILSNQAYWVLKIGRIRDKATTKIHSTLEIESASIGQVKEFSKIYRNLLAKFHLPKKSNFSSKLSLKIIYFILKTLI